MTREKNLRRLFFGGCAISVSFCLAVGASAQERVSPEQFLDFAYGKTLTFDTFPEGRLVGVEEYLRRDLSVWRDRSDICVYGRVTVEDGQVCFLYDNDEDRVPVCWIPFVSEDRWFVLNTNGVRREIQEITRVSEDGLDCPVKPGV